MILFSTFNVMFQTAELTTLHHDPDLRQDLFIIDEYYYLNVPRVGKYTVFDIFDCTFKCLRNPSCLSLNLAASKGADGKFWCELLSSVKYSIPEEYKRNETSLHLLVKVGTTINRAFNVRCNHYNNKAMN